MKISVTGTSGFIGKALCDKLVSLNYVISVLTRKDTLYIADISALVSLLLLFYRNKFDCVHALMPKSAVLAMVAAWVVLTKVRIHFFWPRLVWQV